MQVESQSEHLPRDVLMNWFELHAVTQELDDDCKYLGVEHVKQFVEADPVQVAQVESHGEHRWFNTTVLKVIRLRLVNWG